MLALQQSLSLCLLQLEVLPDRNKFHLWRDDAATGVVHLTDITARARLAWGVEMAEAQRVKRGIAQPPPAVVGTEPRQLFRVAPFLNPGFT